MAIQEPTVLLAAPGLAENAAEVAGNPALVRTASGGNAVHAHRGGAVHTAGLSDAAGLWRDVQIESKAECRAVGSTPVPRISLHVSRFISPNYYSSMDYNTHCYSAHLEHLENRF